MLFRPFLILPLSASLAASTPLHTRQSEDLSSKNAIQWQNITDEKSHLRGMAGLTAFWGKLAVPLDYTLPHSENNTLQLDMVKIPAVKEPKLGSVLTNWGGPGVSGTLYLPAYATLVVAMTGGQYDLIGPDPRGTGEVLPVNCYPNSTAEAKRTTLLVPATTNASENALGEVWAYSTQYAARCAQNEAVNGTLMSTAFVARDFMQVVDALAKEGEDGMLRYWGVSYGSYLGEVLAAMFPDRVERMMLDGVLNPTEYQEGWETAPSWSGDAAVKEFSKQCLETKNTTECALYREDLTADALYDQLVALAEQAKRKPFVMGPNVTTDIITYNNIKSAVNSNLRTTQDVGPVLAAWFNSILTLDNPEYNYTAYLVSHATIAPDPPSADNNQLTRCSDASFRSDKLTDDLVARVEHLEQLGFWGGDVYPTASVLCALWKLQAKERYAGDFKVKTKHPVMLVGSPTDVRTPIDGAYAAQERFEGSRVLQHNGLGHCVMYSTGVCAIKHMATYFVNGTLPEEGTVCEQDFNVFSGKNFLDSVALLAEESQG